MKRWDIGFSEKDNVGPDKIPAEIIQYFSDIVDFASTKFADLQTDVDGNEHHIKVLERAKESGKPPKFLILNPPEIRFFPEDLAKSLRDNFRKTLDNASLEMLECTLKQRYLLRARLRREAEKVLEDVEAEATEKWMEAQGEWNGWDQLYRVTAAVQQGEGLNHVVVPLSATVFRLAMKKCRTQVSTLMETRRLEKAEEQRNRNRERKLRKAALAQASALPRQEAEQSMERRMQDMIQPPKDDIRSLRERVEGNRDAPAAAGADGAATKSAKKSRKKANQDASDEEHAAQEAQPGKKKRRKLLSDARAKTGVLKPPNAAASRDRARKAGYKQNGKHQRRRRNKRQAGNNQE